MMEKIKVVFQRSDGNREGFWIYSGFKVFYHGVDEMLIVVVEKETTDAIFSLGSILRRTRKVRRSPFVSL